MNRGPLMLVGAFVLVILLGVLGRALATPRVIGGPDGPYPVIEDVAPNASPS